MDRRRLTSLCLSILAAIVLSVGCTPSDRLPVELGEGEGEGEGEEEGALAASTYCEELAPLFCPFYLRCGRMDVVDNDACLTAFSRSCEAVFEPRFIPLADAGLLKLSASGLDACAAHLDGVACDEQFFELEGPCAGIWEGTVPAGGACGLDTETFVCAPGTACTLDLSFCGTCEDVLDDGAVCRVGDEGVAVGDEGVAGACGPAAVCGDDDVCVVRPVVGEACVDGGTPCALPARCADDGVCRHPNYVGVGDVCDSNNRCPYESRCSGGVCVESVAEGGACVQPFECATGLFCAGGSCARQVAVGGACDDDDACGSGSCDAGACAGFATRCVGAP